jgi:hypothetical protein
MDVHRHSEIGVGRPSRRTARKLWSVRLLEPLAHPTDNPLSIQLPPGEYELSEQDDIHYELRASREFSVMLRVSEIDHLRTEGHLVIEGMWP